MAVNSQLDLDVAMQQMRSLDLKALFTQTLGWQPIEKKTPGVPAPIEIRSQRGVPIAHHEGITVWQVILADTDLSAELRADIYTAISQTQSIGLPLVIFIDSTKTRSLWCESHTESALYVSGQLTTIWEFRLRRFFHDGGKCMFPRIIPGQADASYERFERLIKSLCEGIAGVSNSQHRQEYAALTIQRLILLQSIQNKGWLNGDTWYLQTCFGKALQTRNDVFFGDYLQPLYQSLTMPALERSLTLTERVGAVPFLGHLFEAHRLEQQYPAIAINDQPFEEILGWLSEQTSTDALNPWLSGNLGYLLERYWAQHTQPETEYTGTPTLARELSRTLDRLLINRLTPFSQPLSQPQNQSQTTLNDLLFNADSRLCRHLTQEILPTLRILDPACGSGNLLVALHQRLTEIFSIVTGYIQQTQDAQLKIWRSGLAEPATASAKPNLLLNIQKRVLKNNLYGVDILAGTTESARLQLLLHTVATAHQPVDLEPPVDLTFNVMTGNSLIGLITVDEERFDQVNKTGESDVLQGNLLQPLVAEGYQTILAEKNLALEHYKFRNQKLAEARNIPAFARAALLRTDILRLDAKAQGKLDALLLNHMSQQLRIQFKATQLAAKPQRKPLTLEDIDVLQPFHWGYHCNQIIQRGGFDVVVCAPPWGAFRPTAAEFLQKFQDLVEAKGVTVRSLKTSKQALAKGDPEVTQAWLFYQDQYAYVADYFYRSEQYAHQNPTTEGKTVRNQLSRERLFIEQCFNLLAPDGMGAVAIEEKLLEQSKALTLTAFLQKCTHLQEENIYHEATGPAFTILTWQMKPDVGDRTA
ncbi:MAG: DNA methyltransferase [Phormidesmis sp.]